MNPLINKQLEEELIKQISYIHSHIPIDPNKEWVRICNCYGTRHYNRWIQIFTSLSIQDIHYEYYGGHACLHLEGEYAGKKYLQQSRELKRRSRKYDDIQWLAPDSNCISCIIREEVNGIKDLIEKLHRLAEIFNDNLNELYGRNTFTFQELKGTYSPIAYHPRDLSNENVSIHNLCITDIFELPLKIPNYQRIFCWKNKQIESLWLSLNAIHENSPYHLGTIILQHRNDKYEVVDGQQRLVTLSLILWRLGYAGHIPLLSERFKDSDAIKHIENAKAVITSLTLTLRNKNLLESITSSLKFSVIVINGDNFDLGYTFFSNQNSKGVKLTDYDLLKAHHLRYIISEPQAIHLANGWTKLTQKEEDVMPIEKSLGKHIYRLRKLLRKENLSEYGHYIRDEFQAAPTMPDIPPFGERFDFYEPIQGGAHFFAFVSHFNNQYKAFEQLPQVFNLRDKFGRRHKVYGDIAETILFSYYLKFDTQYLSEALFCIVSKLAEHRYMKARALELQVQNYAMESNFIQLVQFSTSPTFFLASALEKIQTGIMDYDIHDGIRWDFYKQLCNLFATFDEVTVTEINKRIENDF